MSTVQLNSNYLHARLDLDLKDARRGVGSKHADVFVALEVCAFDLVGLTTLPLLRNAPANRFH